MGNVLSRYNSFFATSFWASPSLRISKSGTSDVLSSGASFIQNFSNRFTIGTAISDLIFGPTVDGADTSGYQLKLTLRKMYVSRRDVFKYSNSNTDNPFTEFVCAFFDKQSNYWYSYKAAYNVPRFFGFSTFNRLSNFLDVNLLDRVYFRTNFTYRACNKGRFNVNSSSKFRTRNFDLQSGLTKFNARSDGMADSNEVFGVPVQPFFLESYGCANFLRANNQSQILQFCGIHSRTNLRALAFQLRLTIVPFCFDTQVFCVDFTASLLPTDFRYAIGAYLAKPVLNFNEPSYPTFINAVSGKLVYCFWWFNSTKSAPFRAFTCSRPEFLLLSVLGTCLRETLRIATIIGVNAGFSIVGVNYWQRFNKFFKLNNLAIQRCLPALLLRRASLRNTLEKIRTNSGLYWVSSYLYFSRIFRIVAGLYFNIFIPSKKEGGGVWRFKETGRTVFLATSTDADEALWPVDDLFGGESTSSIFLLQFFVYWNVRWISFTTYLSGNLPHFASLLFYTRRFHKNFARYNEFLLFVLNSVSSRMSPYSECCSSREVNFLTSLNLVLPNRGYLLSGSESAGVTFEPPINEGSYSAVGLMRLGGGVDHYEFFSLYSAQTLPLLNKINPIKNWSTGSYSMGLEKPLNLEFFDILSAWVFNKTSFDRRPNNLPVQKTFDISDRLHIAFEFRGTWFFNEFDVITLQDKTYSYGNRLSRRLLSNTCASKFLVLPLVIINSKWKKKCREGFSGALVADPRRRIWSDSSPEVLAHKVFIFRRVPVKRVWRHRAKFSLWASEYWQSNFEFAFFQL